MEEKPQSVPIMLLLLPFTLLGIAVYLGLAGSEEVLGVDSDIVFWASLGSGAICYLLIRSRLRATIQGSQPKEPEES